MVNINEIKRKVIALGKVQKWNHNFMLPGGVETSRGNQHSHGKNLVKFGRLAPLFKKINLNEKRVLDVGCNEGFFSLQMGSIGAEVLGVDIDKNRIAKAKYIKSLIGNNAKVSFEIQDIYSSEFGAQPRFDLCLCLGLIHRVPDPYRAIAALADRSDMIIFEWKALKHGPHDDAFAYLSPKDIDKEDFYGTEYWLLGYGTVERILIRHGFKYFYRVDDPRQRRAILVTGRNPHKIFDCSDTILHRGRIRTFLSHTKRYLNTCIGIITGRVNA
jgi:SAM-dependent methyltransferase